MEFQRHDVGDPKLDRQVLIWKKKGKEGAREGARKM